MNTVRALVDAQADARPDATYFIATETGRTLTYVELRESCRRVAAYLARHGLQPGTHVSLVMPNGLATLRILLGAMYGGYCVNPVNLLSGPEPMRYVLEHSDCALVFTAPEWTAKVRELVAAIVTHPYYNQAPPDTCGASSAYHLSAVYDPFTKSAADPQSRGNGVGDMVHRHSAWVLLGSAMQAMWWERPERFGPNTEGAFLPAHLPPGSADIALYEAKANGRNCFRFAAAEPMPSSAPSSQLRGGISRGARASG